MPTTRPHRNASARFAQSVMLVLPIAAKRDVHGAGQFHHGVLRKNRNGLYNGALVKQRVNNILVKRNEFNISLQSAFDRGIAQLPALSRAGWGLQFKCTEIVEIKAYPAGKTSSRLNSADLGRNCSCLASHPAQGGEAPEAVGCPHLME